MMIMMIMEIQHDMLFELFQNLNYSEVKFGVYTILKYPFSFLPLLLLDPKGKASIGIKMFWNICWLNISVSIVIEYPL